MRTEPTARLILGTHDLGLAAPPDPAQRSYWMPFTEFAALLVEVEVEAARHGIPVVLTSDDGFASDHNLLLPWLIEAGRKATFFVPTSFIGRPGHLTPPQLREIHAAGMTIGLHGVDHLNWVEAVPGALQHEIAYGKAQLEEIIGAPVTLAAPPYGAYDARVVAELRSNGITSIHTADGGYALPGLLQTRVMVQRGAAAKQLLALAARGAQLPDRLRSAYHNVRLAVGL